MVGNNGVHLVIGCCDVRGNQQQREKRTDWSFVEKRPLGL